jgi:hypothetical protein
MKELKNILTQIVNDLEKSAISISALESKAEDKRKAGEAAYQKNKNFYDSLRQEIDALPENPNPE